MGDIDTTKRHHRRLIRGMGESEHPVDELVLERPQIAEDTDREAREVSAELAASELARRSPARWTADDDLRFHQRVLREERLRRRRLRDGPPRRARAVGRPGQLTRRALARQPGTTGRLCIPPGTCGYAPRDRPRPGGRPGRLTQRERRVIMPELAIPASDEELELLTELASAAGGSVPEYVRLCVFGPRAERDPVSRLAALEGWRIRSRTERGGRE
jgi:hypothetical protein